MKYLFSFNTDIVNQEQASEWNVDKVMTLGSDISADLLSLPQGEQLVFFIPTTLDYSNSLSYGGANLALRILMKYISNGRTNIDIILMGNESEVNFLLHYDYPNILKIPGFHYVRFNKIYVASFVIPRREQMCAGEYKPYLDNLGLKLPSSFKSTHSLTNEWCLFKWNSFMGFNEDATSLTGHLYFDYLIALEKLNKLSSKSITSHLKERISNFPSARILLIDDNEGWHKFFKEMFSNSQNVEFHCIGENFNKLEFPEIKTRILDEVNGFNPDVIILDYRLMEDKDTEVKDNKMVSGYQVLSKVLKGNYTIPLESYGRQIIIFSATSRIENILLLREGNADGFILKEKPENYNGKEITKSVISKMVSTLEKASTRAYFLIPLNEKLDGLVKIMSLRQYSDKIKLKGDIETMTESIRLLTQKNEINEDILKLVYLDIFKIFETIRKDSGIVNFPNDYSLTIFACEELKVCSKGRTSIYRKSVDDWNCKHKFGLSSEHEKYCKERSLNYAICAIILFRLGYFQVDDTKWNDIRIIRNSLAHGESEQLYRRNLDLSIDTLKHYILEMLKLIEWILDPKYIKEVVPQLSN